MVAARMGIPVVTPTVAGLRVVKYAEITAAYQNATLTNVKSVMARAIA